MITKTENTTTSYRHNISWQAVFAGVLVALSAQLLFSLLGLGIGFSTINPANNYNSVEGLGVGATIWWLMSMLAALFLGGWTAGRLSDKATPSDGMMHGILAFCLMSLFMLYLLTTTVGGLISGATGIVGRGLSLAGQGASAVSPRIGEMIQEQLKTQDIDFTSLRNEAETLLRQTGKPQLQPNALERQARDAGSAVKDAGENVARNPQGADTAALGLINSIFRQGEKTVKTVDREAAINVIVARTGNSREEAGKIADRWIQTYEQALVTFERKKEELKQTTDQAVEATATALSKASLLAFFGLVCSALVAAIGGWVGTSQPVINRTTETTSTLRPEVS
jgi:hypothetical protein